MAVSTSQPARGIALRRTVRREEREETLRLVDYVVFPRASDDPTTRVGFTRDLSPVGLCMGIDDAEPIGALLRVTVRGLDGQPNLVVVAQVVWCSAERDGRYWVGLDFVTGAPGRTPLTSR
jgi:hypothetical protein